MANPHHNTTTQTHSPGGNTLMHKLDILSYVEGMVLGAALAILLVR